MDAVKDQRALDAPADLLDRAFSRALQTTGRAEQQIRNLLHGTWMGHPLHPTLTDVPLGAWTAAFFMDLLSARDGYHPNRGADAAIAVGLAGAGAAAVTGLADWQHIGNPRTRRLGTAHAILNVTATVLYSTSLAMRLAGRRKVGRRASFLGYMVVGVSGYLGGHLVFDRKIGVKHSPVLDPMDEFVPVLPVSELAEGEPRRVIFGGVAVMIVSSDGEVFAITDSCSHLGCSLAAGIIDSGTVKCRCHGSRFNLRDGGVVEGPATFPATTFDVRLNGDQVELRRCIPVDGTAVETSETRAQPLLLTSTTTGNSPG